MRPIQFPDISQTKLENWCGNLKVLKATYSTIKLASLAIVYIFLFSINAIYYIMHTCWNSLPCTKLVGNCFEQPDACTTGTLITWKHLYWRDKETKETSTQVCFLVRSPGYFFHCLMQNWLSISCLLFCAHSRHFYLSIVPKPLYCQMNII